MDHELTNPHAEMNRIDQNQSSAADSNMNNCLFRGPELLIILLVFFAVALALQIAGFDAPMTYDSAAWIEGKSHVFARNQPLAVVGIMSQRPLFMLSLYLNYAIHGMDPIYFRVFNALILAAAGVALVLMLNMVMSLRPAGIRSAGAEARIIIFLIGLLFVVHPLQVFAVLYIWQREALMACLFYFAALATYAAGRGGIIRSPSLAYSLTALIFFAGLLCKENLITLPVTIVLLEFVFFKESWREFIKRALVIGLAALVPFCLYLFLTYHLHGPDAVASTAFQRLHDYFQESGIGLLNVILTESRAWFLYLASIVVPSVSQLQLLRAMEVSTSLFDPPVTALACLGIVGLASLGFALRKREPLVSFGLLFFFIALLPESLLLPQYLFLGYRAILPMAALTLVLARVLILFSTLLSQKLTPSRVKAVLVIVMCLPIIYLSMTTHSIADRWSPMWLWERSYAAAPQYSPRVETAPYLDASLCYGIELINSGDLHGAVEVLQQAADIPAAAGRQKKQRIFFRLGAALTMMGKNEEAIDRLKQAINQDPRWGLPYIGLANLLLEAGDAPAALENLRTAVKMDPRLPEAHFELGRALLTTGDSERAIPSLQRALELNPYYPDASASLGKALLNVGRLEEAVDHTKKALSALQRSPEIHNTLAEAYRRLGRSQEAQYHFKRVLEIQPGHQDAKRNLLLLSPTEAK